MANDHSEANATETEIQASAIRCCRNCEYFDAGGSVFLATSIMGDCLNPAGKWFTPLATAVCPAWYSENNEILPQNHVESGPDDE